METLDGIYQLRAANKEREFLNRLISDADAVRETLTNTHGNLKLLVASPSYCFYSVLNCFVLWPC